MSKIYIDPGHGGSDPGAVKYVTERTVAVKVAKYMDAYLQANYSCSTKTSTGTDSTNQRAAEANKWGADLFVSIHFNAGGGDGYEAWLYSSANNKLGQTFEKYVKAAGQNSRGLKYSKELNVLRLTKMPAILNEIAFVDNKKDIADWNEDSELKQMGYALAKAAADYLNLKKTKEEFKVQVKVASLNIRSGPGVTYKKVGAITDKGTYTITEINGKWGKLKSGKGWINISTTYCKRV